MNGAGYRYHAMEKDCCRGLGLSKPVWPVTDIILLNYYKNYSRQHKSK